MWKRFSLALFALILSVGIVHATTFTSTRAAAGFPVFKPAGSGLLAVASGTIAVAINPVAADIYKLTKVPAGACVVGGMLYMDDMDTNGTETLDVNVGWAANGSDAADPDGFGNFGVSNGDAVTNVKPEVSTLLAFNGVLKDGPKCFVNETTIEVEAIAVAATFAAGDLTVAVYYYVP